MKVVRKVLLAVVLAAGLVTGGAVTTQAQAPVTLRGAGATFPFPLYSHWAAVYYRERGVRIDYASIGSGAGIRQFMAGLVDFAGTDAIMTDEQIRQVGRRVHHIPMVAGAVVPVYNVAGVGPGLRFTGEILADIFLGNIRRWNDPRLVRINPRVNLPDAEITVVRRADSSGTTAIFTNYLSRVSSQWRERVGEGTTVAWPVGLGGRGNEGVAGLVQRTPNSIGYVEFAWGRLNRLTMGHLQNRAGQFMAPSMSATTRAVHGALPTMPADFRVFFTNPEGRDVWPIAAFTWILIHGEQADSVRGRALVEFLWWALHDGQRHAEPLGYAALPPSLRDRVAATLRTVTAEGRTLLP